MTAPSLLHRRWIAVVLPLAALISALLAWWTLPYDALRHFASEEGPIERSTVAFYFLMAIAYTVFARRGDSLSTRAALVVLMAAFGAREMDLHKAWTEKSVLKVSFYLESHPLHQKLVALAVLAAVIVALALLARRHALGVWRGFRAGDTVCTTVLIFIVTMVVSKILDRSVNVLLVDYGVVTPAVTNALVGAIEEIVELSLPLMAGVGLAQHLTQPR